MTSQLVIFRAFFIYFLFVAPTLNLKKKSRKSTNKKFGLNIVLIALYFKKTPFNASANRADPDQASLVRAAWSGSTLFAFEKGYI